jgi:hypothetical protein
MPSFSEAANRHASTQRVLLHIGGWVSTLGCMPKHWQSTGTLSDFKQRSCTRLDKCSGTKCCPTSWQRSTTTHPPTPSLTHSLTHSFAHSLTHLHFQVPGRSERCPQLRTLPVLRCSKGCKRLRAGEAHAVTLELAQKASTCPHRWTATLERSHSTIP